MPSPSRTFRRILSIVAVVLVLLGAAVLVYVATRPRPTIDRETFARIRTGMSRPEVIGVIGAPPGNYTPMDWTGGRKERDVFLTYGNAASREKWLGEQGGILVFFDAEGKVLYTHWFD
jgi:hypothetical protein